MNQKTLEWAPMVEYNEVIVAGNVSFRKGFELYISRTGWLAWAPYKHGHEPHINPQEVRVDYAGELDIGEILSEMAQIELKNAAVPAPMMVENNRDLVSRILADLGNFSKNKK